MVRSGEHRLTPRESVDALVVFPVRRRAVLPACMLVLVAGCSSAADDEPPLTDGSLGQGIIGQRRAATAYTEGCSPPPTASRSIPAARGPLIMTRFRGHPNSAAWAGVPDAGAASLALVNDLPGALVDLSSDTPPRRRGPGRRRSQRA